MHAVCSDHAAVVVSIRRRHSSLEQGIFEDDDSKEEEEEEAKENRQQYSMMFFFLLLGALVPFFLFHSQTGECIKQLSTHNGCVLTLLYVPASPSSSLSVASSSFPSSSSPASSSSSSSSSSSHSANIDVQCPQGTIWSGGSDRAILVWDVRTLTLVHSIPDAHPQRVGSRA